MCFILVASHVRNEYQKGVKFSIQTRQNFEIEGTVHTNIETVN